MGAAVPGWMVKLLKIGLKAIDEVGERIEADTSSETEEINEE